MTTETTRLPYDVAILGGGIVGCALFRELTRFDLSVVLLERENDVSLGASRANSAIVHAGYDPPRGSQMARLNIAGNPMFTKWCDDLDVRFVRNGSLVTAFCDEDLFSLAALLENGRANGVEGLAILSQDAVRTMEPNLSPDVSGGLFAPTGGIVGAYELTIALAENGVVNGGVLKLNFCVSAIRRPPNEGSPFEVVSQKGESVEARFVVNATGVEADLVHQLVAPPTFEIRPRKGEYYVFDKSQGGLFSRTIFSCPGRFGKGVLLTPTVHGNLMAGPNAQEGGSREETGSTSFGLNFVREQARRLTATLDFSASIRNFAGLRAVSDQSDFILGEVPQVPGFFNAAGMKSPGLTAAPAIAEWMRDRLADAGLSLVEKKGFVSERRETGFFSLPPAERARRVAVDPGLGRVICRCESITEGEVIEAIRRPVGATTLDGVKRRVRPGCGRCQGGFCSMRVLEILARELGVPPCDIEQDRTGSWILSGPTK